ncbi:zinc-dependent alcohol dehydrogenase family protein [Novosphingobium sp. Leaf2]|uniref:zinc-dependent alcohol dehydrogenase family protein n=1 Tax=Novosphingobium sp. Leaf2 TaxID=1735670 RepID=UPI00070130C6|nr:NAD(P)-dependent alcohol dehydrogenase [Novosphingobium sp. Leaf2]KQM22204.1 alcohol dehydrogenase [Novosphingobium sp. Leaf2]
MKAFEIGEQSGLESLKATTRPTPVAGPGQAVVAPRLISLNNRDLQILRGAYGAKKAVDRVPVSEGVGEVVSVGEGVSAVKVGDRVISPHFVNWAGGTFGYHAFGFDVGVTHDGWLAEQVVLPATSLIRVPEAIADENAAALASAGLTAWNALVEVGKVKAGDLVLCLGTGGVAIYALKLAKAAGARVAITSSSDEKLELARALGADITINYKTHPEWGVELMAQTGNAGADIVVETGGQGTLGQSIAAAAVNGRIVIIGVTAGQGMSVPGYGTIIGKNLTLKGIANGSREMLVNLVRAVEANGIETVVNKTFAFDEAPAAYAYLDAAEHVGKVLISLR